MNAAIPSLALLADPIYFLVFNCKLLKVGMGNSALSQKSAFCHRLITAMQ